MKWRVTTWEELIKSGGGEDITQRGRKQRYNSRKAPGTRRQESWAGRALRAASRRTHRALMPLGEVSAWTKSGHRAQCESGNMQRRERRNSTGFLNSRRGPKSNEWYVAILQGRLSELGGCPLHTTWEAGQPTCRYTTSQKLEKRRSLVTGNLRFQEIGDPTLTWVRKSFITAKK